MRGFIDADSEGAGRLRVGPWVPDPSDRPRSGAHRSPGPGPGPAAARVGTRPEPVDVEPVPERRRHAANRPWLLVVAIVVGLGTVASVPLFAAGHPSPPGAPPVPIASGMPGAPVLDGSGDASPDPSSGPSTAAPPPVHPSRTATRVPPPQPAPRTYEAEDPANTVSGTARVDDYPGASGGRIVRNIGNWEGSRKAGWLRFNAVTAPRTGTYLLTFSYVHLDDATARTVVVQVSGSAPISLTVTGGATCCATARQRIVLQQGVNTITFSNPADHAPSIDKIVISAS